ncbi:MAG: hypothetical protein KC656_16565, partial [Myxococcales bacterium]|nr:hypothetical protein [Myxococcales bacterium]
LEVDPMHQAANLNLGVLALLAGDHTQALARFDVAGDVPDARTGRALALTATGRLREARELWERALTEDPADATAIGGLVRTLEPTEALTRLDAWLTIHPQPENHPLWALHGQTARAIEADAHRRQVEREARKAEQARERRSKELLAQLPTRLDALEAATACMEAGSAAEAAMLVEQGRALLELEDADLAGELVTLLDAWATEPCP